jgi:hypothetical protein
VFHNKFGEGVIVTLEGAGEEARAQVNFGRHGMKWLALSVAKLTPVFLNEDTTCESSFDTRRLRCPPPAFSPAAPIRSSTRSGAASRPHRPICAARRCS